MERLPELMGTPDTRSLQGDAAADSLNIEGNMETDTEQSLSEEEGMNYLEEYYNKYDEEGRLLSRHGQVEYLTTMKYIRECLSNATDPTILEVGAGTGRYSVTLAKQGYRVTAVELIPHNLELLKSKLEGSEQIRPILGNALDLSFLPDSSFSLVMVLGPMYHLYTKEEKLRALSEAVRVTKPGGFILVAYCMN